MQIWIHDSKMKKIVALNNNIPEMLHYSNSAWHPYLDQATSTFDFTIPKFVNGKLHEDIKLINDECFVSFYANGSHQVFYIATLQEDDFNIQLTCNNTNLEYALEYANPFSASGAQTIEWYLNHMELLSFAAVELGYNEIPDRKRTLTFDSQETKMARLQSLMSNFDAEFEFKTELNRDGTYKRIVINIYQKADETHHGIGKIRNDVILYYDNDLKGVQVNSDKTQMFNAGVFTGKDGLSLNDVEISEKNADGIEEFYSRKGTPYLYAPLAMNRYRATMRAEGQDNWIRKDFSTEYENINDLKAYALRTLKQYAYPLITYTASVQSKFIGNYSDLALGDTVKIIDNNFAGGLALEARVSEMIISFDNPNNNSVVFTNYRRIDNKPTSALQSRIDKAVEDRLPYHIELATTNGTSFKNNEGESLVKPSLFKGNKPFTTDVTWRWALDGVVTVGMQYLVKAKDIDDTAVLTVSGYVGNTEVATTEITLANVNDGADGAKGDKGDKGDKGADSCAHTAYANITRLCNESSSFTLSAKSIVRYGRDDKWIYKTLEAGTYTASNSFFGGDPYNGLGKYCELVSDFSLTDSTGRSWLGIYSDNNVDTVANPSYFTWQLTKGERGPQGIQGLQGPKGDQGIQGPKGTDGKTQYTHIAYADNATGGGFSQTDQTKAYIGMYVDFTATDSNDPTKYRWSKWHGDKGATGDQGIQGPKGDDGRTPYLHIAYANSADGRTDFSTSNTDNKRYLGTYTDYTQADSTDPTKYKWVDMVGSVEVGIKNLILKSNDFANPHKQNGANTTVTSTDDYFVIKSTGYTENAWGGMSWNMSISEVKAGEEFSILMPVYIDSSIPLDNGWSFNIKNHLSNSIAYDYGIPVTKKDEWFNVAITFKAYKDVVFDTYPFWVYIVKNGLVRIKPPTLVRGNVIPSEHMLAPEDIQADINSKADQALTQQQLNALAEQNSIVKAEMEAKASIDTVNQWITAYQNYVAANDEARAESEKNLQEAAARILQLKTDVGALRQQWDFIDTYMSIQNEGLIIGKSDGSAFAKFANDRISLFSGSSEVMYISQGTLHIENGIFTKTIQIGRFRFETHPADADMLVLRYLGG